MYCAIAHYPFADLVVFWISDRARFRVIDTNVNSLSDGDRRRQLEIRLARCEELAALCELIKHTEILWHACEHELTVLATNSRGIQWQIALEHQRSLSIPINWWERMVPGTRLLRQLLLKPQISVQELQARWHNIATKMKKLMRQKNEYESFFAATEQPFNELLAQTGVMPNVVAQEIENLRAQLGSDHQAGLAYVSHGVQPIFSIDNHSAGCVMNQHEFYRALEFDIRRARTSIEIVSPYVSRSRSESIWPQLLNARRRGVSLTIYMKPVEEQGANLQDAAIELIRKGQKEDIRIIEVPLIHQKVALIDNRICWEGSLNMLSHKNTDELMRRLDGTQTVLQVRKKLKFLVSDHSHADAVSDLKNQDLLTLPSFA